MDLNERFQNWLSREVGFTRSTMSRQDYTKMMRLFAKAGLKRTNFALSINDFDSPVEYAVAHAEKMRNWHKKRKLDDDQAEEARLLREANRPKTTRTCKKMKAERDASVLKDFTDGVSKNTLMDRFGISFRTVQAIACECTPEEERPALYALRRANISNAKEYG